jgi:hypothetical protein
MEFRRFQNIRLTRCVKHFPSGGNQPKLSQVRRLEARSQSMRIHPQLPAAAKHIAMNRINSIMPPALNNAQPRQKWGTHTVFCCLFHPSRAARFLLLKCFRARSLPCVVEKPLLQIVLDCQPLAVVNQNGHTRRKPFLQLVIARAFEIGRHFRLSDQKPIQNVTHRAEALALV